MNILITDLRMTQDFGGVELLDATNNRRIDVKVPLPGVDRNLQDHMSVLVAYAHKETGEFHKAMRLDRIAEAQAAGQSISAGGVTLQPRKPDWARFDWPKDTPE